MKWIWILFLTLVLANPMHAASSRGNQALVGLTSATLPTKVVLKWTYKTGQ